MDPFRPEGYLSLPTGELAFYLPAGDYLYVSLSQGTAASDLNPISQTGLGRDAFTKYLRLHLKGIAAKVLLYISAYPVAKDNIWSQVAVKRCQIL